MSETKLENEKRFAFLVCNPNLLFPHTVVESKVIQGLHLCAFTYIFNDIRAFSLYFFTFIIQNLKHDNIEGTAEITVYKQINGK